MSCDNENEYARLQIKYTSIPGASPSLPYTQDHNDGTWSPTDLYVGEFFLNASDDKLWIRTFNGIIPVGGTGSGTGSYVGDFVSKTMGGSYSGTVSVPHLNGHDLTYVDGTFTNVYTTDLWATTLHGDGSGLTGIISEWNGGTVSGTASFTNTTYFEGETWLDGSVRSSFGEVVFADNLSSYGTITANTFVGDGSQLTGITGLSYSDIYTTSAWLDGTVVRFDRNDLSDAYSVDLTPLIGTYSPQSFNWDGANTMTVYLVDGSYLTMTLDTFDTLNANTINANEVYANTFYGSFVGDFLGGMTGSTGSTGPSGATGPNGAPGTNGFMIVNTTWANFSTRYFAGTMTKGVRYKITDIVSTEAGPIAIWVDALDTNKISNTALMEMTIVNGDVYSDDAGGVYRGMWSQYGCGSGLTPPAIGNKVVWGGHLWTNTSGNIGTKTSKYLLSGADWTKISKTTVDAQYIKKTFDIELSITDTTWVDTFVTKMSDNYGNTVRLQSTFSQPNWTINDWGDRFIRNNDSYGIFGNIVVSKLQGNTMLSDGNNNGIIYYNQIMRLYNNTSMSITQNQMLDGDIYDNYVGIIGGNITSGQIHDNILTLDNTLSSNGETGYSYGIFYNTFYGDITFNTPSGDISYNTNNNGISDNSNTGPIEFNKNNGSISSNTSNVLNISYNSNNGNISSNSNIGILEGNMNLGDIDLNTSNVTDISSNTNAGVIYGNSNEGQIYLNSNDGYISSNMNVGDISRNNNNGLISDNANNGGIILNSNSNDIQGNTSNVTTISFNSNNGNIYYNYNTGSIYGNTNQGNISSNSCTGDILSNANRGVITSNSISGSIEGNTNNGFISTNTQSSGTTNIKFNNNNGDIIGGRTGNVLGTIVNI